MYISFGEIDMTRILLLPVLTFAALAQEAAPPAFEVASVKPSTPDQPVMAAGGRGMMMRVARGCRKPNPGSVNCTSATLKMLLMQAYDMKNYQVEGPSWLDNDTYDLMAKIPEGVPVEKVPSMLQALLAERFKVVLHKETRSLPAYELTVAKGGPKMKEVDPAEVAAFKEAQKANSGGPPPGTPPPPPPPMPGTPGAARPMPLGAMSMMMSSNGARTMRGKMDMLQLVNMLTNQLKRPVFDKTELKGTYDIELSFMDETDTSLRALGPPDAGIPPPTTDANAPIATLTQAVQQSLGLKLDQKKAPLDILVIESANKVPTEN